MLAQPPKNRPPLAVVYQPGGIGALAFKNTVTQQPPDGKTVVAFSSGSLLNLAQNRFGPYNTRSVRWLAAVGMDYGVVAVPRESRYKNLPQLLEDVSEDDFDRIVAVNMKAIYLAMREVVPRFKQHGRGVVLNMASTAGVSPRPRLGWYNASKGWVITATRACAVELAPFGIRVNALNPVAGETPLLKTFMGEDTPEMRADHEATVLRLFQACRRNRLEMLLEIIPSKVAPVDDMTSAQVIQRFYDLGVYPDWWKLEPFATDAAYANACDAITRNDPHVRGIVVLGLDAAEPELAASLALAAKHDLVKGFAVGRTIFGDAARGWLAGKLTDDQAVQDMATKYARLCGIWDAARAAQGEKA